MNKRERKRRYEYCITSAPSILDVPDAIACVRTLPYSQYGLPFRFFVLHRDKRGERQREVWARSCGYGFMPTMFYRMHYVASCPVNLPK